MVVVEKELEIEEGLRLVEKTGAHKKQLVAWDLFNDIFIKAPLEIKSVSVRSKSLQMMATNSESKGNLNLLINGSGELNLFVSEFALGFSAELYSYKENGLLELEKPKNFLLFERRDGDRFLLDGEILVSLQNNNKIVKKRCLDISAGGLSLIFSKSDAANIRLEKSAQIIIHLGKKDIQVTTEVVDTQKLMPFVHSEAPYGGVRYSLKFLSLDPTMKQFIVNYIKVVQQIRDPAR